VDNVHTSGLGLGRTWGGLAQIPHVSGTSQCFQGRECSSSPTSGTARPLVRGVFALMCGHCPVAGPSDAVRGLCLAPRGPVPLCGWRGQGPGWWTLRLLDLGVCAVLSVCFSGQLLAFTRSWSRVVVTT
jgi:hypothetical protein